MVKENAQTVPPGKQHPHGQRKFDPDGIGLCLSGGGYRAMLFHLGSLWRLNELGYLPKLDRISSVSGGSITMGVLAMNWDSLVFDSQGVATNLSQQLAVPLRKMASKSIDTKAIVKGVLRPFHTVGDSTSADYRTLLFGHTTLQDLPDTPRFVFNATGYKSGVLWRFSKPYARNYEVGEIAHPEIELAVVVAASSAFPPILSPVNLKVPASDYTGNSAAGPESVRYIKKVQLADGGIYDNMGMETVLKRYGHVLVSDAGGKMKSKRNVSKRWLPQTIRVIEIIDNQVRSLHRRMLMDLYQRGERQGAFWDMRMDVANQTHFSAPGIQRVDYRTIEELAGVSTRLKRIPPSLQERLVNWGYAVADAALRSHYEPLQSARPPDQVPYPETGLVTD